MMAALHGLQVSPQVLPIFWETKLKANPSTIPTPMAMTVL
jgi:hypothetical protein